MSVEKPKRAGRRTTKDLSKNGNGSHTAATGTTVANGTVTGPEGDLQVQPLDPVVLGRETLLHALRLMMLSRRLDEKMLNLLKQGKGNFHIGAAGHEASQVAIGMQMRPQADWSCPYYRDMAYALSLGFTPREMMLAHLSKADDITSGGRQMPEHYSSPSLQTFVPASAVGAQFLPAVGFGMAIRRQGAPSVSYVSGGEGSTSQGAFHEAMNWAAKDHLPVLFHVQDNRYAISVPRNEQTAGGGVFEITRGFESLARCRFDGTDFLQSYAVAQAAFQYLRAGKGPVVLVADVVRLLPHSSSDNDLKYRPGEEIEAEKQRDPIRRLEAVLIDAGMAGQDELDALRSAVRDEVDEAARWAADFADPDPATVEQHVFFDGSLDLTYGVETPVGESVVLVDAINHALREEMERDERVLVYGEDVGGPKGGVFSVTQGLTERFGADRCFNTPLAENSIVGTAVGLAAAGYRPVVEIQFGDYIWPAMQQMRNVLPSVRYRSNGAWSSPVVLRVPVGGYIHGGPYHSQNIESIFAHIPGFLIAYPSNAADAKGLLKTAIRNEDPVLFLEHKGLYRQQAARSPEPGPDYLLPFGKARVVREGSDLTLVTYGAMVYKALNVARLMEKEGVSIEIIDLRTIVPLDMETVLGSISRTNRAIVVYEDQKFVGFGAEISAQIMETAFHELDAPVLRVAARFSVVPFAPALEAAMLPSDDDILAAVRTLLTY